MGLTIYRGGLKFRIRFKALIGAIFILIASILYAGRYICAAIGASKSDTWCEKEFAVFLSIVPSNLLKMKNQSPAKLRGSDFLLK